MTDDPALDVCAAFVAAEEGFRAYPYRDVAGIPTIGYGQTYLADGSKVTMMTPPMAQSVAVVYLRGLLAKTYLPAVRRALITPPTINQAAALGSLCYNVGPGNFRASSLVYCINNGHTTEIEGQFLVWDKVRDQDTHELVVSNGLLNRRRREYALYATPDEDEAPAAPIPPAPPPHEIAAELMAESPSADDLNQQQLDKIKGT